MYSPRLSMPFVQLLAQPDMTMRHVRFSRPPSFFDVMASTGVWRNVPPSKIDKAKRYAELNNLDLEVDGNRARFKRGEVTPVGTIRMGDNETEVPSD